MGRGEKDRYSSRDERSDRGHGGGRDRKDDERDGGSSRRGRDRSRSPGRKRGRHDRDSSRERATKDSRDGGGSSSKRKVRGSCCYCTYVTASIVQTGFGSRSAFSLGLCERWERIASFPLLVSQLQCGKKFCFTIPRSYNISPHRATLLL